MRLRLYLADLGHNLLTLSSDVYPLGIANLATYARAKLEGRVELELSIFREPQDLKRAIDNGAPDLLGLSNYAWNEELSNHFAGRPMAEGGPVWEREGFVTPVLAGALAQLDCALHQAVDAGDHTLFIGLVERAVVAEGEGAPLGYYRGKYVTSG